MAVRADGPAIGASWLWVPVESSSLDTGEAEKHTESGKSFFLISVKYNQRFGK